MAGGWSKQGSGVPLSERVRPGAPVADEPASEPIPARHCWVADPVDRPGTRRVAVLVEWRPGGSGWEGRVAYPAQLRPGVWVVVEEWLPAALLTPL